MTVIKTRILFSLLLLLATSLPVTAQMDPGLNQVTLYWYSAPSKFRLDFDSQEADLQKTDASRSSINFVTGALGPGTSQNHLKYGGEYHLQYGETVIGNSPDGLRVLDCRDKIVELGTKEWRDFKETPPSPFAKTSRLPEHADDMILCPHWAFEVKPGQMYLVRISRGSWLGRKEIYVMFRVDDVVTRDKCVLSWKLVKPPNVDDQEERRFGDGRGE